MSWVKTFLSGVFIVACLGCSSEAGDDPESPELGTNSEEWIAPTEFPTTTNTNQCIQDLGGIQVCQNRNAFGLPVDIQACCDGVRQLAMDRCECSPALDALLGEQGQQIYEIEPLCRIVQFAKWVPVVPRAFRSCASLQTKRYGCEQNDMQVDAARLSAILSFQSLFAGTTDEAVCLDTPAFADKLSKLFTPDASVTVPYGVGAYKGYHDIAEYLGMTFSSLNHGFWQNDITPDPTKRAVLKVSANGSVWTSGSTARGGDFLRGRLPYTDLYTEQDVTFPGCETRISDYSLVATEGMRFLIERYVQASDLSKRWGVEDICRYHTKFCADDPTTRQYESEAACLEYLNGLPLYTEACGPNRPLNGHSISCKFKHHFMIAANPKLHCPHIGPQGRADPNNKFKCDDVTECSTDEGQDAWPPVTAIGANTPPDVRKAFEESNVGYETEPFGCAIPTEDRDHHH